MPKRKKPYREGDWIAFPLQHGGYGLALVARVDVIGLLFLYIAGKRYFDGPYPSDTEEWNAQNCAAVTLGTHEGNWGETEWRVIGRLPNFDRSEWPLPDFGLEWLPGEVYRKTFDPDTRSFYTPLRQVRVQPSDIHGLPRDGVRPRMFVEILADRTLSGGLPDKQFEYESKAVPRDEEWGGPGPFSNDSAADWVGDFTFLPTVRDLKAALAEAIDAGDEADAPQCQIGIAAAETVAALCGSPHPKLPDRLKRWVKRAKVKTVPQLTTLALQALERIRTQSELKELWEETEYYSDWLAAVTDLEARLKRCANPAG